MSNRPSASGGMPANDLDHHQAAAEHSAMRQGLLYGVLAYGWWGLIPLYFKTVHHVRPIEILAHRVVWSCLLLAVVISVGRRWQSFLTALGNRHVLLTLAVTTALIATNWFTYIYAIDATRLLQASLGYFITPLANVCLGVVFLQERLSRLQIVSIAVAVVGVVMLAVLGGEFPWISLGLATSFSLYGLLRKTVKIDGLMGLFIETLILLPLSSAMLGWFLVEGDAAFRLDDPATDGLLMLGGVVTAVPLLAFAAAARRLRMSTLGFLQYLAPSVQFLLAVLAFGEPFSRWQIASFGCIWTAIGLYSLDSLLPYWRPQHDRRVDAAVTELETPVADAVDGLENSQA